MLQILNATLSANKHIIVLGCFWRQKMELNLYTLERFDRFLWKTRVKFVLFNPCSPHPLPNVCEYKDTSCGGKHHAHVSENSSKVDQASCSHQQEKQGRCTNILWNYPTRKVNRLKGLDVYCWVQTRQKQNVSLFIGCCDWIPDHSQALQ